MSTKKPRDSQRARVYRAELPLAASPLPGLAACARFAERVVGTLWWHGRFPALTQDRIPRFRPGHGARTAYFTEAEDGDDWSITLPRRYRTKGIVLHELAHWALVDQPDLPTHGATFARLVLDATSEFCGPDRAQALTDAYRAERVRVGAPPRQGPDGRWRYGWDERLRLSVERPVAVRAGAGPTVTGVLEAVHRDHIVVRDADASRRVATTTVWSVERAP
ncbi:MAG TPA: hypothetical protein VGU73_01375 [Acidimicrobiia bacterium]|nr:hypothetical protein [Acidimicrobiia bacterium]